ncbi:hypothetical protein HPP92_014198, partial [Vanilla planifolia]
MGFDPRGTSCLLPSKNWCSSLAERWRRWTFSFANDVVIGLLEIGVPFGFWVLMDDVRVESKRRDK